MCHNSCIDFGRDSIKEEEIRSKSVIEIGSHNINGTLRHIIEGFKPGLYIGVDINFGPGVDQICLAEDITKKFGYNRFDVLICTELLEHVKNWQDVVHSIKNVIKPNGVLFLTTRSKGIRYHGFPFDFWRYELSDMEFIFSDFTIEILKADPEVPGVFLKASKPINFVEKQPNKHKLYSIIQGRRSSVAKNNLYWLIVGLILWKIFGRSKHFNGIMHYTTHPFAVPFLIRKKCIESVSKILSSVNFRSCDKLR